jgi:hypothetical protein
MKKILFFLSFLCTGYFGFSQALPTPYLQTKIKLANGDTTWIGTLDQLTSLFNSGGTVTSVGTGTGLTGGTITSTGTIRVATNGIVDSLIRQSVGLSIIGRSTNTTGNVADITAASDKQVLRRDGTSIGFGAIDIASSSAVTGILPVANGGTGLSTIAARSILLANSANTYTTITPTANQSIRINSDNTAWEAFTPLSSITGTSPVSVTGTGDTRAVSLSTAYGDALNPYGSKTANFFLAAPNGTAGVPTFRAIVAADIPTLNQNTTGSAATLTTARTIQTNLGSTTAASFNGSDNITPGVTGTLGVANGGTGQTTFTDGQLLIGNTTGNTLTKATLTAGTGISITNGAGAITIGATYGSIPLASGNIFVGNGSNIATATAVTGDVTISNSGVTAIATGVIVDADINTNAAIARTKLASGTADHVLINSATGVMSSEAQLSPSRGGTGQSTLVASRNVLDGFTTTTTSAITTTLTSASTYNQVFTGSSTQTITLPSTGTLVTGAGYLIVNNSTGTLTVQTSTSATLGTIPGGLSVRVMVLSTSGNTVNDWEFTYAEFATITGTGNTMVLQTTPRIVNPTLAGVRYSTAATFSADVNSQGSGSMPDSAVINITSSPANPGGVTLPIATAGKTVTVYNNTTTPRTVNIYPQSGSFIDALSINTSIALAPGGVITFTATSGTQWYSSTREVTNLSFSTGTLPLSQTTGTLPISQGGTGLTSAGTANTILGSTGTAFTNFVLATINEPGVVQVRRDQDLGDADSLVINIPDASTSWRGLVTTGDQTFAGNKTLTGFLSVETGLTTKEGPTSAALTINGSVRNKVTTLTASTTLDLSHNTINVNNTVEMTLTLPTCNTLVSGLTYTVYKISNNNNAVIIARGGTDTFVGGATSKFLINQGTDATCTCNGSGVWTYSSL